MRRGRGGLALLLMAGGCVPAAPPPPQVAVAPGPDWRTPPGPAAPLAADWWRAFGDPVLDGLIDRALTANPDLAIAAARVREARAQEGLSRAQLLPSLDAAANGGRTRSLSAFGTPIETTSIEPVFETSHLASLNFTA